MTKKGEYRPALHIEFPVDLKRQLKIAAAEEGTTLRETIIRAAKEYLARRKKR